MSMGHNTLDKVGNACADGQSVKLQSGDTFLIETPSGTNLFSVDSDGNLVLAGGVTASGAISGTDIAGTGDVVAVGGNFSGNVDVSGRLTTADGVASGTVMVVGGRAYSATSASDNLLASAGGSVHVDHAQTYSIPANTLKAGTVLKISGMVRVTNSSGTDTLEVKLYLGATTLLTTTAFDPDAAGDFVMFEAELVSRAAPGAAVELTGIAKWTTLDGSTLARAEVILAPTAHATNGALVVKVSSKWSATTASTNARLEMLNVEIL